MRVSMIAAIGEGNRVLGKDKKLLWHIPEDMKFFRDTTRGHAVIMGRKTFESLGKPLPQRMNIIVSRNPNKIANTGECLFVDSLEKAIALAKDWEPKNDDAEIFIIGGAQIYTAALPFADRLYLTLVEGQYEGDAFFPEYPEFTRVISERKSEGNGYTYTFLTLQRSS